MQYRKDRCFISNDGTTLVRLVRKPKQGEILADFLDLVDGVRQWSGGEFDDEMELMRDFRNLSSLEKTLYKDLYKEM